MRCSCSKVEQEHFIGCFLSFRINVLYLKACIRAVSAVVIRLREILRLHGYVEQNRERLGYDLRQAIFKTFQPGASSKAVVCSRFCKFRERGGYGRLTLFPRHLDSSNYLAFSAE
mgnify:FL=1